MIKILSFVLCKTGHFLLDRPLCSALFSENIYSRGLEFVQVIYESFDCDLKQVFFIHDLNKWMFKTNFLMHKRANLNGLEKTGNYKRYQ